MKLYVIVSRHQSQGNDVDVSLAAAAKAAGLEYVRIIVEDTALDDLRTLSTDEPALLYRINTSYKASAIESALVWHQPNMFTTMYYPCTVLVPSKALMELNQQMAAGLNIIPTTIVDASWQTFNDDQLSQRVDALDGFPIVVKTLGQSHGRGVQKVDTLQDLRAIIDGLGELNNVVIMRKYLADYANYRLIIIDNKLTAAIEYHKPDDDFRTNAATELIVTVPDAQTIHPEMVELARSAVELRSSILGGVDILQDNTTGIAYLAEVNAPCNYSRAEKFTGKDLSGLLIKTLLAKQANEQKERA